MEQTGWSWCSKCQGLYFAGSGESSCPSGAEHDATGSGHYVVDDNPGSHPHGQPQWSWCHKCQGLAYGPQLGASHCPAGDQHDGSGSGDYTLDVEADDTPASAQRGWRWCNKCQGLFFSGNGVGSCPAGDGHDSSGSGLYVVSIQQPLMLAAMLQPMVFLAPLALTSLIHDAPQFAPDQETAITANHGAVITDSNGAAWCTLNAWLGLPTGFDKASWQCRRSQLTITLPQAQAGAQVLPFSDGFPTASMALQGGTLALTVALDPDAVRLIATFSDDTPGHAAYTEAIAALSHAGVPALTLTTQHDVTIVEPAAAPEPIPLDELPRNLPGRFRVMPSRLVMRDAPMLAAKAQFFVEPGGADLQPVLAHPISKEQMRLDWSEVKVGRTDWNRVFIPPAAGPASHTATVNVVDTAVLTTAPATQGAAFPDIIGAKASVWQSFTPPGQQTMSYMPGSRPELFYYLPTAYKLGFHVGTEGDAPGQPFSVTMSEGTDGKLSIAVTMTAMPYLSHDDRALLHEYLLQHEIQGLPYLELSPAVGLKAEFNGDFIAGGADLGSISCELVGASSSELLEIRFTMKELDYGLMAPLLERGITGTVQLSQDGSLSRTVPVLLHLDDVVTNAVAATVVAAGSTVSVTNALVYPIEIHRLAMDLVYRGDGIDGVIFGAQEVELLSAPLTLSGGATSDPLAFTQKLPGANQVVFALGAVTVHGPAPKDWISSVNRSSSLQGKDLSVTLSAQLAQAGGAVQVVQLLVVVPGDAQPRPAVNMRVDKDFDLTVALSLEQLAAGVDPAHGTLLEYTSVLPDSSASLPQRIALDLSAKQLVLLVLCESPGAQYYVDSDTPFGPASRELAVQQIATLRSAGKTWTVRAVVPAPAPTG